MHTFTGEENKPEDQIRNNATRKLVSACTSPRSMLRPTLQSLESSSIFPHSMYCCITNGSQYAKELDNLEEMLPKKKAKGCRKLRLRCSVQRHDGIYRIEVAQVLASHLKNFPCGPFRLVQGR